LIFAKQKRTKNRTILNLYILLYDGGDDVKHFFFICVKYNVWLNNNINHFKLLKYYQHISIQVQKFNIVTIDIVC